MGAQMTNTRRETPESEITLAVVIKALTIMFPSESPEFFRGVRTGLLAGHRPHDQLAPFALNEALGKVDQLSAETESLSVDKWGLPRGAP